MKTSRIAFLMSTAAAFVLVVPALAQDREEDFDDFLLDETPAKAAPVFTSELEAGIGWQSQDSFKFGEFSGLEDKGVFAVGNFHIQWRDAFDDDNAAYFIAEGLDLGLESRSIHARYGRQGLFEVHASYDRIPKFFLDDARTFFTRADGGTNLQLPANWVPSNRNISQLTQLNANLQPVQIKHDREKAGAGFSWNLDRNWSIKGDFHREYKDGTRTIAAGFGTNGGNPAFSIVPEPIDYETDRLRFTLGYTGKKAQLELSYDLSLFRNDKEALRFENPFTGPWVPAASFPDGIGQLALPPDNKAHNVRLGGNYILSDDTRANATFSYTRMTQDDAFLPFTVNPLIIANTPLPRDSLNGEINTWLGIATLSSRLTQDLSLKLNVRYENRDNNTPRDVFLTVPGDAANQGTIFDATARINLPYSRKQWLAEADATWRITDSTRFAAGYRFEQLERTFTEVRKTREHKLHTKLSTRPLPDLSAWVGFDYSIRNGTEYIDNLPFLSSHTPEHVGPDPENEFENNPFLRKFYIADRDQAKTHGAIDWTISEQVTAGLRGRHVNNDYDSTLIGLTGSTQTSATADLSWSATALLTAYAFYTYEKLDWEQTGLSSRSTTPLGDFSNIDLLGWTVNTQDDVNSAGFGTRWTAIKDKLDFDINYTFSRATTEFDFTAGSTLSFVELPDLETTRHSIEGRCDWHFAENKLVRIGYLFEDFKTRDFAQDGIDPDTMNFVIGLGDRSPDFSAHVVSLSTVIRF